MVTILESDSHSVSNTGKRSGFNQIFKSHIFLSKCLRVRSVKLENPYCKKLRSRFWSTGRCKVLGPLVRWFSHRVFNTGKLSGLNQIFKSKQLSSLKLLNPYCAKLRSRFWILGRYKNLSPLVRYLSDEGNFLILVRPKCTRKFFTHFISGWIWGNILSLLQRARLKDSRDFKLSLLGSISSFLQL